MKKIYNRVYQKPIAFSLMTMLFFIITTSLFSNIPHQMGYSLPSAVIHCLLEVLIYGLMALKLKGRIGRGFRLGITTRHLGQALLLLSTFHISYLVNFGGLMETLGNLSPEATAQQIFTAVLSGIFFGLRPGISEELVYRVCIMGYLMYMWAEKPNRIHRAVWISAAIFGMTHIFNVFYNGLAITLIQCVYATALGALLGAVYARTRNILALMAAHALVDSISLISRELPVPEAVLQQKAAAQANLQPSDFLLYITLTIVWTVTALFLLRRQKLAQAEALWKAEALPREEESLDIAA